MTSRGQQSLHPTARRILDGAREVLLTKGFQALTLTSIAAASNANRALIKYHFGNKKGLVAALVDDVVHDESVSLQKLLDSVPDSERTAEFVKSVDVLSGDTESFRVFFDLLPETLRDGELHARMASLYEWYVDMKLAWLGLDPRRHPDRAREMVGLGELMVAVVDGMALQRLVRGDQFDASRALDILELMLSESWHHFSQLQLQSAGAWGPEEAVSP